MSQIKCECGYEIRVIGRGEKGLCNVVKASDSQETRYSGNYDECVKWLADRAVKVTNHT